jgi:hypothetical protein
MNQQTLTTLLPSFLPLHRRRNNATADLLVRTENSFGRLGFIVPRKSSQRRDVVRAYPNPKRLSRFFNR